MSLILSINTIPMHVTLHTGDPGDATASHRHDNDAPVDPPPASPLDRPALATEVLPDGTIQHASWWWPDGRQATWGDLEAARVARLISDELADLRRWRQRVAAALWQATRGGRR